MPQHEAEARTLARLRARPHPALVAGDDALHRGAADPGAGKLVLRVQALEGVRKQASHTALSDVRDSIEELRHYRRHMAALAGE